MKSKDVYPSNYRIALQPDLKKFTFKGTELITLQIEKSVKTVNLDAVNLEVTTVHLLDGGERKELPFKQTKTALEIDASLLEDGENELEIEFTGELNDKLAGFYRSDYEEHGKVKYLATTQFEAADARQAFPCFDSPAYKATFDITLIVDQSLTAISNMPVLKEEKLEEGLKAITFDTTPIMSTYLLYFGVGEFEIKESKYKNVLLRGITTKGKSEYTEFALETTKKSLAFFEEYFDIPYPLPKLDLLAIPDFASGAMENWGAITFRENALLFYPKTSSLSTKQRVAEVVAHEVAHQWFGNLVTMKWWDDLWLNESFATFMSYKVMEKNWPEWDVWTQYLMMTVFEGMYLDSLKSSHPIKVEVNTIEEMNELFDEIAYDKGGSVLRMIERFMGEEAFRQGLRTYMTKFKYGNTQGDDLWTALDEQHPEDIKPLVEKYVTQIGFPYVSVLSNNIEQKRFLSDESDHKQLWNVPLVIHYKNSHKNLVLTKKSENFESENLQTINADYGGFFISKYEPEVFSKVVKSYNKLTPREKIGFIHDLFYLAKFRKGKLEQFITFVQENVLSEKHPAVILYAAECIDFILLVTKNQQLEKLQTEITTYSLELVGHEPKENENSFNPFLRAAAFFYLSETGNKEVQIFLEKKFQEYLKSPSSLHPDLKQAVLSNAVVVSDENYQKIKNLYLKSSVQEEIVKLLTALAKTQNQELLQDTLMFLLGKDVKFANVFYAVNSAANNPIGKDIILNWMLDNWDEFGKRVGGHGGVLLRRFVKLIVPTSGIGHEDRIKEFIEKNRIIGLEKSFEQVWEELEINSNFVKSIT